MKEKIFGSGTYFKLLILLMALTSFACEKNESAAKSDLNEKTTFDFPNILNLRGIPDSSIDRSVFIFADKGAWHGYSLPDPEVPSHLGSFTGPYLLTQENGIWLGKSLNQLEIKIGDHLVDLSNAIVLESNAYPGSLRQVFQIKDPALRIETTLTFPSNRTALINLNIENEGLEDINQISISWNGGIWLNDVNLAIEDNSVLLDFTKYGNIGGIYFSPSPDIEIDTSKGSFKSHFNTPLLKPKKQLSLYSTQSFCFTRTEWEKEKQQVKKILSSPEKLWQENTKVWNQKAQLVLKSLQPNFSGITEQRIAMKCFQTLVTNWRSPAGFFKHDGLFPSYNYEWFNGFWSWDSWKHAVAIAHFDTQLAQNQIRAMYDFQDEQGMIADCVYRDTLIENFNWRDTKPPLSAWATWKVYEKSNDTLFLKELYPKIEKYHQWWYLYRDHNKNGLCEYGSTDGTLIAAKWESGMDNAVRFDNTQLVRNNETGWSMNRESVDLNAYLFAEKKYLSKIANALGDLEKSDQYDNDAKRLKTQIQTVFFDEETGWFYDVDLESQQQLKVLGAEGWIPLWTKAASQEQAKIVSLKMLDTTKFATFIPFPTLSADHPKFKPDGGYWRGPVWLDQVYFAITGLKNYGFRSEAEQLTIQLLNRLEGLSEDAPIRENYHPLTGQGLESNHFSWSAAHLLLLMIEE